MHFSSLQFIKFHSVSKSFGPKPVLFDLSFSISKGERIALIGENGSGKSTLAKIAAGQESPSHGEVVSSENCTIGYLPQHVGSEAERNITLGDFILESNGNLLATSSRLRELEKIMAAPSEKYELKCAMTEWDTLHRDFLEKDGYGYSERSLKCLSVLGLNDIELDRPLVSFSGGESRRIALAILLLKQPDILILDEPTNHLDLSALEWLEHYLRQYKGAVLLISHDRCFLGRVANGIFELSSSTHQLQYYPGNYDAYISQKKKERQKLFEEYQRQKDEISSLKRLIKEQTYSTKKVPSPKDRNKMSYDRRGEKHANAKRRMISQAKAKLDDLEAEKMTHPISKGCQGIVFRPKLLEGSDAIRLDVIQLHAV